MKTGLKGNVMEKMASSLHLLYKLFTKINIIILFNVTNLLVNLTSLQSEEIKYNVTLFVITKKYVQNTSSACISIKLFTIVFGYK